MTRQTTTSLTMNEMLFQGRVARSKEMHRLAATLARRLSTVFAGLVPTTALPRQG